MVSLVLSWIPFVPEMANWVSWETMRFMVWFCRALEQFHWTYEYVQAPVAIMIVAYYVGLLAMLAGRLWVTASAIVVLVCDSFVAGGHGDDGHGLTGERRDLCGLRRGRETIC